MRKLTPELKKILEENIEKIPHPVSLVKIKFKHPDDWAERIEDLLVEIALKLVQERKRATTKTTGQSPET